jgi:type VI secretion system protein VasD
MIGKSMIGRLTRRVLLAGPVALAACAAPPPPPPPPVLELTVIGGADQNPDTTGKPVAVALHLFELVGTAKFERADIFALIEREKATLGADSPASEEFVIAPGETRTITHPLKPDVQFVGLTALFRDIDNATWRAKQPVAPHGVTKLVVRTSGLKVTMTPP